jgi:predicted nucleic acid-binding protein
LRVALDTNVLVYAEGVNGDSLRSAALSLIEQIDPQNTFVPVQVLGELFRVLVRKAHWKPEQARASLLSWQDSFPLIETSATVLFAAAELSANHNLGIWDAVVLSAAAGAGCRLLLSEDLHHGFTWSGVTVVNPFADPMHELLARMLAP